MKKYLIVIIVFTTFVCLFYSCKSQKKIKNNTDFIPYVLMLEADLKKLDSTPTSITQYNIDSVGKILDSINITKAEFRTLAKIFMEPNITSKDLINEYDEKSFLDEFTNAYNFSYTTTNESLPIRNVVVSTSVKDNSKFKNLIMSKVYTKNGKKIVEQLYWKTDAYCTISKTITENSITTFENKKIVWGM